MNPIDEKEKEKPDSSPMEDDKPEPAPADQETEESPTQSRGDTSSSASSSKTPSLATLLKIADSFGKDKVPEFIRTLIIEDLKKGQTQISDDSELDIPSPDPSGSDSSSGDRNYFDVLVTNSNCLPISYEVAAAFFPFGATSSNAERTLQLTDSLNHHQHDMTYMWFENEDAFILTRNWSEYAVRFNLLQRDRVRFTRPESTPQQPTPLNHLHPHPQPVFCFLTRHFPRPEGEPLQINLPVFIPDDFLFQLELTLSDARFGRLALSKEQVKTQIPDMEEIPRGKYEMAKFTDCNDKDWFLKIVYSKSSERFMVMDGWEKIVKEHDLAPGDLVRFYDADTHQMHFLIQFVKQKRGGGESSGESGGRPDAGERSGGSKDTVEDGVARELSGMSLGGNGD